ncbi:hypothetical protein [Pararhodospirillum oryzae]|uniref:Uncharacterized protein n=1 Tax=Pararhodospirillum oryzae TaxID=478448 RepID=A0A512H9B4_9PROT|nr:hypothetical protein [Pararhodospirillum oryzae]GEO82049.1 hypothetical protein ROR02_21800 [Pararhodospirillum oryzae]
MTEDTERLSRLEALLETIRDKLATLDPALEGLARVQADQNHHRASLGRAFGRLEAAEERQNTLTGQVNRVQRDLVDDLAALRGRLNVQTALVSGMLAGASAAGGLLMLALRTDLVAVLQALRAAGHGG